LSTKSAEVEKADQASYYTLLTALVLGMMLLGSANHLLMLYLALEMVSVLSYILTGSLRGVRRSSEAALKYVIYGGVASGIMAYGLSLLYGMTGTMAFPEIAAFLKANAVSRPALFVSILLIMGGIGFKIASFPFHMWCPDVYEGAPTPFTAFLSVGPKAAGFAALIRFFLVGLMTPGQDAAVGTFLAVKPVGLVEMLTVLSIATMTIGNLAALVQNNLKRLLAYSSIAHAGYLLMGFAALSQEALNAVLFYLVVYVIMNIGAFLVVLVVSNQLGVEDMAGYKGLGRRGGRGTFLGLIMTVFMFSLTGIPPMAGFIGKFYLFGAVLKAGLYGLAIAGVLNSVVSLYYYVRVVKVMFFDAPDDARDIAIPAVSQSWILAGLAGLTLYLGLFWNGLAMVTSRSTGLYASAYAPPAVEAPAAAAPAPTATPPAATSPANP
jgi:NADH-quinone oxidoreductase subunit N